MLVLNEALKTDQRVAALSATDRWAFIVLATMGLRSAGAISYLVYEDLPAAIEREALTKRDAQLLLGRLVKAGLLVYNAAGMKYYVDPVAYREVEK